MQRLPQQAAAGDTEQPEGLPWKDHTQKHAWVRGRRPQSDCRTGRSGAESVVYLALFSVSGFEVEASKLLRSDSGIRVPFAIDVVSDSLYGTGNSALCLF